MTQHLPEHTPELIDQLAQWIHRLGEQELEADLPDVQCAMVSLLYAEQALGKLPNTLAPKDFLRRYVQLLENRYSRLEAEDAGEYGSGRDVLGTIIEQSLRRLNSPVRDVA